MNLRFDVPFFGVLVLIKYGFRSVSSDQREITMILKTCEIKGFMRDIKWSFQGLCVFALDCKVELVPNWLDVVEV